MLLLSGGAKGIGYACAACLGHEGAQVVIADIDETAAQQAAQRLQLEGVAASAFRCDVGTKEEVRASQYPESPLTRPEVPWGRILPLESPRGSDDALPLCCWMWCWNNVAMLKGLPLCRWVQRHC